MPHFPLFVNLRGQRALVVGGGKVALRKVQKLRPYGPAICLVAPQICDELMKMDGLNLRPRAFQVSDLRPRPALVIAATDDFEVNREIAALCKKRHIPVNVVDDPENCSFQFPALVHRGELSAGISTGGASPAAAVYFKERFQALLPEGIEQMLDWLEEQRPILKREIPEQSRRAAAFRRLFSACLEKGAPLTEQEAALCLEADIKPVGSVALVGAGCGRADLITVRGLELLKQCQAVVYDDLIDPALLDATPETALRVYMGKRSGSHSARQDEINQKLIELARMGYRVVRLKGGDPYLFGRGGEEMLALKAAGIPCQEVPGICSPIGISAEAGIPVTHRGLSRSLHIVTAHTSDTPDGLPRDFDALAALDGTLVFLMGLEQLPRIVSRLMAAGKGGDTPAAVLSGGNSAHPAQVRAPLSEIEEAVRRSGVSAPAIILVGRVARLNLND